MDIKTNGIAPCLRREMHHHEPIIVLESNQNHATITGNGICTTLTASAGLGGDMYL